MCLVTLRLLSLGRLESLRPRIIDAVISIDLGGNWKYATVIL